jgi:hypothetical protein
MKFSMLRTFLLSWENSKEQQIANQEEQKFYKTEE